MAKNISPLVIEAVLDTSGIDRGVNNIRSKLNRARGGGGGGGGFGSGINPAGGISDGGLAAAAMAAAFGAGVAARAGMGPNLRSLRSGFSYQKAADVAGFGKMGKAAINNLNRSNFVSSILTSISDFNFSLRNEYSKKAKEYRHRGYTMSRMRGSAYAAEDIFEMRDRMDYFNSMAATAGARGKKYREKATQFASTLRNAQRNISSFVRATSALGAGLSIGGAAGASMAIGNFFNPLSMEQRFSDISRFEGSGNYEAIRRLKASSYQTPTMTMGQSFWTGAQSAAGNKKSMLQQMGENLSTGAQNAAAIGGGIMEQLFTAGYNAIYPIVEDKLSKSVVYRGLGNELRRTTN